MNYYNENDLKTAAWLNELIASSLIPMGYVDTRSIVEVQPEDLTGFTQCHFFAGIGGWSYALQLAGWPEDEPVWTGSCPCQPFSAAGKQKGVEDERHLWPEFWRLVAYCDPPVVFGEQVASKAGREWLVGVRDDLEALGYAVGSADLCAAGAGAPHIRQRLYWVADAGHEQTRRTTRTLEETRGRAFDKSSGCSATIRLGDTDITRSQGRRIDAGEYAGECVAGETGAVGGVGESMHSEWRSFDGPREDVLDRYDAGRAQAHSEPGASGKVRGLEHPYMPCGNGRTRSGQQQVHNKGNGTGFWSAFDIVHCTDNKARRIEPGSFPLAYGIPARMGRLRGYGNSIVPQVAATFVEAYRDC